MHVDSVAARACRLQKLRALLSLRCIEFVRREGGHEVTVDGKRKRGSGIKRGRCEASEIGVALDLKGSSRCKREASGTANRLSSEHLVPPNQKTQPWLVTGWSSDLFKPCTLLETPFVLGKADSWDERDEVDNTNRLVVLPEDCGRSD